jgi:peptidoglycan/LPS O-acetylase OafA/YrhL
LVGSASRVMSLDAIRGIAALAVSLFHYGLFSFGYLGVELFFLLSGFVLTLPSRHGSLRDFVVARCIRLYPAYWVCLAVTCSAALVAGERVSLVDIGANATMLTALLGRRYIDGVYWSLTEELVFYGLVGMAGAYSARRNPLVLASVMAAISPIYATALGSSIVDDGKASLCIKFLPFFSVGIAAAVLYRHFGMSERQSRGQLVWASACAVVSACITVLYRYASHRPSHVVSAERYAIGVVFLLFAAAVVMACRERTAAAPARRTSVSMSLGLLAAFGACTYPYYLLHDRFGKLLTVDLSDRPTLRFIVVFVTVTSLSMLIHFFVEVRLAEALRKLVWRSTFRPASMSRFEGSRASR